MTNEIRKVNTKTIHLTETSSTNEWLRTYKPQDDKEMTIVSTDFQTTGHGQGTNTWESGRGQNLLFSIMVHPRHLPVGKQFLLSEAAANAFREALCKYLPEEEVTVKWPNDIYYKDQKISGTLIETSISSKGMGRAVIGTGINVNQKVFASDAPNPVSLCQILGHDIDRNELMEHIIEAFSRQYDMLDQGLYADISSQYHSTLYRKTGFHRYQDSEGEFEGALIEVEDDGHLILHDRQGLVRSYAFKEIKFLKD